MKRWKKRKILLLVDNCAAHPLTAISKLGNIRLHFLPPNTTSIVQPCNQGIIQYLMVNYRHQVIKKIITDIDQDSTLTANQLAKQLKCCDTIHMLTWHKLQLLKALEKRDSQTKLKPQLLMWIQLPCYGDQTDTELCEFILMDENNRTSEESDNSDGDDDFILLTTPSGVCDALKLFREFLGRETCRWLFKFVCPGRPVWNLGLSSTEAIQVYTVY